MNRRKPEEITDPEELRSMALRKCGVLLKSQDYTEQRLRMKLRTAGFPEDTGRSILRIDGSTRGNAGTGVDEQVRIRKV